MRLQAQDLLERRTDVSRCFCVPLLFSEKCRTFDTFACCVCCCCAYFRLAVHTFARHFRTLMQLPCSCVQKVHPLVQLKFFRSRRSRKMRVALASQEAQKGKGSKGRRSGEPRSVKQGGNVRALRCCSNCTLNGCCFILHTGILITQERCRCLYALHVFSVRAIVPELSFFANVSR